MMRLLVLCALVLGCDEQLAGVGEPCNTSGECAAGLLCDYSRRPHTCQSAGGLHDFSIPEITDMGVELDLTVED
jgi:hypothetical protein